MLKEVWVIFLFWLVAQLGKLSEFLVAEATGAKKEIKKRKRREVRRAKVQAVGGRLPNRRVSPLAGV